MMRRTTYAGNSVRLHRRRSPQHKARTLILWCCQGNEDTRQWWCCRSRAGWHRCSRCSRTGCSETGEDQPQRTLRCSCRRSALRGRQHRNTQVSPEHHRSRRNWEREGEVGRWGRGEWWEVGVVGGGEGSGGEVERWGGGGGKWGGGEEERWRGGEVGRWGSEDGVWLALKD